MSRGVLILVLSTDSVPKVRAALTRLIVPHAADAVVILDDASAAHFTTDVKTQVTEGLIAQLEMLPPHAGNRLIIDHRAHCDMSDLQDWWLAARFGDRGVSTLALKTIQRELKDHLDAKGISWRTHAVAELEKFEGPQIKLDVWLQQFQTLGRPDVGRKLAAKLRVIKTGAFVKTAFAPQAASLIGHRQANCYVRDSDDGGSWVEMQSLLMHTFPMGSVFPVHWDKDAQRLDFPATDVDEFVIYEDGLWSGSEAVRRLEAIAAAPPAARVTFRFGVVTDFGISVVRQAIRSLGLTASVTVDTTGLQAERFLSSPVPGHLETGVGMAQSEYFKELHEHVAPYAFREAANWSADEIAFCEDVGHQLVGRWLRLKKGREPTVEEVGVFALGGGRFGSMLAFSRSIPKVCLPLLWLDGLVEIGGKRLNWRPLLADARRVSSHSALDRT
ncbi:hypothetical protein [uncultured Sphingomonas sp.]|uniref:phosphoribosyltransferase-like protein n=1 Tax=uncultured Sphingomonas sp. TaxID=158754 RepID=UPI003748AD7D